MQIMTIKKNFICTGCTLLCDDVDFKLIGTTISSDVDCSQAQAFIQKANQHLLTPSQPRPNVEELAKSIADRLRSADAPLVVGLNHLTTEAQQVAWRIADVVGATIDVTLSKANRASIYALQRQGKVTATLGEIANRGDLVVFWFCDPVKTHPRLIQRLTQTPSAMKKRIVLIGDAASATAEVADDVFDLSDDEAAYFIRSARTALNPGIETTAALSEDAKRLAAMAAECKYGSWIYGHTRHAAEVDDVMLASQALVRELNDLTRFVSLGLRSDQNAASGENVLAAFSGYPAAVNLAMGFPQYNGAEFAAESLLENQETDFVLLLAGFGSADEIKTLSPAARRYLSNVPKAVITSDAAGNLPADFDYEFCLEVDLPGVNDSGEFCRADDVSLGVDALLGGARSTAFKFLETILHELRSSPSI